MTFFLGVLCFIYFMLERFSPPRLPGPHPQASASGPWETFITDYFIAKEGPERIQHQCLTLIYAFPEMKLLFPKQNYNFLPPSSYTHLCEIYIFPGSGSAYSAAGQYVDQSWEYINRSQTHECGNWYRGRAFPRKGIHKWDFRWSVQHDTSSVLLHNSGYCSSCVTKPCLPSTMDHSTKWLYSYLVWWLLHV